MNRSRTCLLLAGVLLTLAVPSVVSAAGAPATVKLHVEGATATLLATTSVTTTTTPVRKDADPTHTCTGTSALGALDDATKGNWTGPWFGGGLGYSPSTILGETADSNSAFWQFYVNGLYQNTGLCATELSAGDDVVLFDGCYSGAPAPTCIPGEPLVLTVPATAVPGTPFTVHVTQTTTTFDMNFVGTSMLTPAAGASVTGGAAPVTTNAAGDATVTLSAAGPATLRATSSGRVPDEQTLCATTGSDGACGTTVPTPNTPAPVVAQGPPPAPDTTPPLNTIASISEHHAFAAGHGPRTLAGTAVDASGVRRVSLRLTRTVKGHCATFVARKAVFAGIRCGAAHGLWFQAGTSASWSYLLPAVLPTGRYVLDVRVTDVAGNYTHRLDPGLERVVFTVA